MQVWLLVASLALVLCAVTLALFKAHRRLRAADGEEQLSARELRRLRDISAFTADWQWEQDAELRFTSFFGGTISRHQVPVEHLLGHRRWEIPGLVCDPAEMAAHRVTVEAHQPYYDFEYGVRKADGDFRWYVSSGRPEYDEQGNFVGYFGYARNETRRKQAELALQESQQRLAAILDALPVALVVLDAAGKVQLWNVAAQRLFGVRREDIVGRSDARNAEGAMAAAVLGEHLLGHADPATVAPRSEEIRCETIRGQTLWLHVLSVALHDSNQSFSGTIRVVQDITARRNAEEKAHREHADLDEAQRIAALGSMRWVPGARLAHCSSQMISLLGLPPGEVDQPIRRLLGRINRRCRRELIAQWRALQSSGIAVEARCSVDSTSGRHLLVRGHLEVSAEREPVLRVTATDVSDLEIARASANSARALFETLFEHSPVALSLSDLDRRVLVKVNSAWRGLFGIEADEAIGQSTLALGLWFDPQERDAMLDTVAREGRVSRMEVHGQPRNGEPRVCELSGVQLDLDGRRMFLSSVVDVSTQRALQARVERMNQELEMRVAHRSEELRAKHAELGLAMQQLVQAEKLAALGGLVAGVAHELNSPLGNTLTLASSLRQRIGSFARSLEDGSLRKSTLAGFTQDAGEVAGLIEHNARRASELMTNFKQVAADQTSERRRRFDLKNTIEGVVAALRPRLAHVPQKLELDLPDDIELDSYPGPLEQVITNFINNALLHAFDDRSDGHMSLSAETLGDEQVRIVFADDGNGMAPETMQHAFEPFFSTRVGHGGTGLGLYIVRNLIEAPLGGTLTLESTLGTGTRLTVDLPLAAPANPPGTH
ncbi:PAS domain S-box protein [Niveibacterium sp.]|uniref:PAS domain-containing sensor histidine kinase n=1 Tax=Niveibacterium sp. TaxID=2017444 RepID=UPI0035B4D79A